MNAVAVRRSGAPSAPVRLSSLVLAALATGIPLFLLILGLSIKTYQAIRESRTEVELIPLPPPPAPEPAHPSRARIAAHATAPSPAAARSAPVIDQSIPIVPLPLTQPPSADISGTGTAPGAGTGGTGPGGNGNGPVGGTLVRPSPPVRTGASWVFKPGTPELAPYNPPRARNEFVTGQAILNCRVLRGGKVADCRVIHEAPRLYGFGRAALAASSLFVLKPPTINGEPDEIRRVEIPVTFNNHR